MRIDNPEIKKEANFTAISSGSASNNSMFLDSSDNIIKIKNNGGDVKEIINVDQPYTLLTSETFSPTSTSKTINFTASSRVKIFFDLYENQATEYPVYLQVNGISSSSYGSLYVSNAGIASNTSTSWYLCSQLSETQAFSGTYEIKKALVETTGTYNTVIFGYGGPYEINVTSLMNGRMNADGSTSTISSITLTSSGHIGGTVKVYQVN